MIGAALVAIVATAQMRPAASAASELVVRSNGVVIERARLGEDRKIIVVGPLGPTVIEIQNRRARIAADPGRQQICVRQGWLEHAGDVALCLPNRIAIELIGAAPVYDSLNY